LYRLLKIVFLVHNTGSDRKVARAAVKKILNGAAAAGSRRVEIYYRHPLYEWVPWQFTIPHVINLVCWLKIFFRVSDLMDSDESEKNFQDVNRTYMTRPETTLH